MRGDGDPRGLVGAARTALAQTDPDLALYWLRTFDESRVIKTAGFRIVGTMFGMFAGVALVLAAAGLFGVLAFHVGQRTREIGVRRALGADDRRILLTRHARERPADPARHRHRHGAAAVHGARARRHPGDQSPYDPVIYSMVLALMMASRSSRP